MARERALAVTRRSVLAGVLGGFVAPACSEAKSRVDRQKVLQGLTSRVFLPTYEEAALQSTNLAQSLEALKGDPAGNLALSQEAYRRARAAWKKSDAFLFGPADDLTVTGGAVDVGPVDATKLEAVILASDALDSTRVEALGANVRGFHAIEWLLFDTQAPDDVLRRLTGAGVAERRRTLLGLLGSDLARTIAKVKDAWSPSGGNYAGEVDRAGRGSSTYPQERQGVDAVVNSLIAAAEILIAVRLAKPLGLDANPPGVKPELEESPRSDGSLADLDAVLEGIARVYGVDRTGAALTLSDAVRDVNVGADDAVRKAIDDARAKLRAFPGPLRLAWSTNEVAIRDLHATIRELKRKLTTEAAGALGTSVGFNVTDGD